MTDMKIQRRGISNSHFKARGAIFFIVVVCLLAQISLVSAFTWDNVKEYNPNIKEVIIKNSWGFGEEVAKIKLNTPLNILVPIGYQKVAEFDLTYYLDDNGGLDKMNFYDKKNSMQQIVRNFEFRVKGTKEITVNDYENICNEFTSNGTLICKDKIVGSHKEEEVIWKEFKPNDLQKSEKVTIGIFTNVKQGDIVEWVPTFYGIEIEEWATWTESLNTNLIQYWALEDNLADTVVVAGIGTNGVLAGGNTEDKSVVGIVNNGFDLDGAGDRIDVSSLNIDMSSDMTFNMWMKPDALSSQQNFFTPTGAGTFQFILDDAGGGGQDDGLRILYDSVSFVSTADLVAGQWFMITVTYDGINANVYINGLLNGSASVSPAGTTTAIEIGSYNVGTNPFAGLIDEIGVWTRELSQAELTQLYNDGAGITYTDVFNQDPIIVLNSPSSANYTTSQNIQINLTASDDFDLDSVKLYVNDILNQTNSTGVNNSVYLFNLSLGDGDYTIYGRATDNETIETNSSSIRIVIDGTNPAVDISAPNTTITSGAIGRNETLNWTATDTHIDSCWYDYDGTNSTVTCSDNTTKFLLEIDNLNLTFYANDTFGNLNITTMSWKYQILENSQDYNSTVLETTSSTFLLNVTLLSGLRLSTVELIYNGTSTIATATESPSQQYKILASKDIPSVSANTNITFFWNITLDNGITISTLSNNQTIVNFNIDDCTTYTYRLFNFTIVDEDTQTKLTGPSDNTSIKIDLTLANLNNRLINTTFSQNYTGVNPGRVCLESDLGNSEFRVDAIIEYNARDRFTEFYHIQNYMLTNSTDDQNITLYNLNSSLGQEFKITYKDENFNLVPGALIQIQRKYINEGVFKTIEIPKIGSAGYTIGHLIRNDIIYNLIILKEGIILATFTDIIASCQNPTLTECQININSFASNIDPISFSNTGSFSSTLTYNETTKIISSVFVITSGVPSIVTLNATLFDALGNQTICTDSLNSAGGTLSCTVPTTFGNSTVIVKIYVDNVEKRKGILTLGKTASQIYGNNLIFIALMIIFTLIGMSITENPTTLGFILFLGFIILGVLNVTNNFGWIGTSATILWFGIAIVILLIKGSNRQ